MADLKELLGDDYKEGMTLAEVEAAISGKKLADLSSGKYTNIDKFAAMEKKAKEAADKAAEFEKKLKEKMTEEERLSEAAKEAEEQRLAEEQKKAEAYKNLQLTNCRLLMEKEFSKTGIAEEQYDQLIGAFETDDPAKAIAFSKGITDLLAKERTVIEQKVKAEAMAGMTPPGIGGGGAEKSLSLEEIMQRANQGENINELMKYLKD